MSRPAFTLLLLLLAALLVPFVTASTRPADKLTSGKRAAAPQPSRRMGISRETSSKGSSKAAGKRKPHEQKQAGLVSRKDFSSFLCPDGATACPVPAPGSDRSTATESDLHQITTWLASGFECIPTDEELNSCGGCLSLGQGFVTHLLSYCRREPWMSSSELTSALALDPGPLAGKIARRSRIRATSRATGARASSSAARRASSSAPMARPAFGRLQPARATSRRRPCAVSTRSLFARQGLHLRRLPGLSRSSACIISSPSFDISISPSLRHSHSSRRSLNFCRPSCAISTQSVPSNLLDLPPLDILLRSGPSPPSALFEIFSSI
jgi:hypothetical protein